MAEQISGSDSEFEKNEIESTTLLYRGPVFCFCPEEVNAGLNPRPDLLH
jgi:hypothetical protein